MSLAFTAAQTPVEGEGASGSIEIPSGSQQGDLVFLTCATNGSILSVPSGWTVLAIGATDQACLCKILTTADLSAGELTFGFGEAGVASYVLNAFGYRATGGGIAIDAANVGGISSGIVTPAVTTSYTNDTVVSILIGAYGGGGTPVTGVPSGGWTERVAVNYVTYCSTYVADLVVASEGSTGNIQWAGSGTAGGEGQITVALYEVPIAPLAPTQTSPTSGSAADATQIIDLEASYNPTNGASMHAYALQVKVDSGAVQYFNATTQALQSGAVWNTLAAAPGATFTVALPANLFANGHTISWALATQESSAGDDGPFAAFSQFTTSLGPTLSVTSPSGSVITPEPTVVWSPSPASGQSLTAWRVVIYSAAQYGAGGFTPGVSPSTWDSGVEAGSAASAMVGLALANATSFRAYVQVTQSNGETSPWEYSSFSVNYDSPAQPSLVGSVVDYPGTQLPAVLLTATGADNLGTANQSSVELGTTTGFSAGSNTAISAVTTWASDGSYSLQLKATASGAISAQWSGGLSGCPVSGGEELTVWVVLRAASVARSATLGVSWYNSAGTLLSTTTIDTANDSASANTVLSGQATAPSGAAYAALVVTISGCAANEEHFADQWGLFPGVATEWTLGGNVGVASMEFQVSQDGGATWNDLRFGALVLESAAQTASCYDTESVPLTTMVYRVRVVAPYQGTTVYSPWSNTVSTQSTVYPKWGLSNPLVQGSGVALDLNGNPSKTLRQVDTEFDPQGRPLGVKLTDGFKGVDWGLVFRTGNLTDQNALEALLTQTGALLLQSPLGGQWYVTVIGSPEVEFQYETGQHPIQDTTVSLRQVNSP